MSTQAGTSQDPASSIPDSVEAQSTKSYQEWENSIGRCRAFAPHMSMLAFDERVEQSYHKAQHGDKSAGLVELAGLDWKSGFDRQSIVRGFYQKEWPKSISQGSVCNLRREAQTEENLALLYEDYRAASKSGAPINLDASVQGKVLSASSQHLADLYLGNRAHLEKMMEAQAIHVGREITAELTGTRATCSAQQEAKDPLKKAEGSSHAGSCPSASTCTIQEAEHNCKSSCSQPSQEF